MQLRFTSVFYAIALNEWHFPVTVSNLVGESWKLWEDADLLERDKNIRTRTPTFLLSSSEFRGTASYIPGRRGAVTTYQFISLWNHEVDSFPLTRSGISSANCNRIFRRRIYSCEFLLGREDRSQSENIAFSENSIRYEGEPYTLEKERKYTYIISSSSLCHRMSAKYNENFDVENG